MIERESLIPGVETVEDSLLFMHRAAAAFDAVRVIQLQRDRFRTVHEQQALRTVCDPLTLSQSPDGQNGLWSVQLYDRCAWDDSYWGTVERTVAVFNSAEPDSSGNRPFAQGPMQMRMNRSGQRLHVPSLEYQEDMLGNGLQNEQIDFMRWTLTALRRARAIVSRNDASSSEHPLPRRYAA